MYGWVTFAHGGTPVFPNIDVFNTKYEKTASYLYTIDPNTEIFYFVLSRKVPIGSRIRLKPKGRTGAVGTKNKYCGKWGSVGGSSDKKSKHTLDAAIIEISDEGNINGLTSRSVDIKWSKKRNVSASFSLELSTEINNITILLFHVNFAKFKKLFTKFPNKRGGAKIITSSHDEIDYVSAFTMQQLVNKQKKRN